MDEPFKDNLVEDFNYDYDYPDSNNGEKSLTKWHELDIILRKILCGGVLSTMSILGIIGNIMSIIVFTRPKMNSSSDTILLGKNFACTVKLGNKELFGHCEIVPLSQMFLSANCSL